MRNKDYYTLDAKYSKVLKLLDDVVNMQTNISNSLIQIENRLKILESFHKQGDFENWGT